MGELTANDAIKSYLDGKKTPYQLDLEVKDRKPSIIPRVGDRVKIKSREWYEKWKNKTGYVNIHSKPYQFTGCLAEYCGRVVTISKEDSLGFSIKKDNMDWGWIPEFFEEVYPVQEQISSISQRINFNSLTMDVPDLILSKDDLDRLASDVLKSRIQVAKGISLTDFPKGLTCKKTNPELKQIKTTHLIKLKKL